MKAADWVLSQPWAITEEMLGTILAIAERRAESPEALEARLGRPLDNTRSVSVRDGVAIIPVMGPIARYADFFTEISGATAIDDLAKDFRTAMDDRSVKAVVLNMDSPGGTVAGVAEFAGHVAAARGQKPIVCYVGSRAQSAGYWIASAADQIVVDPTSQLGSIGVVMGMRRKMGNENTIEFVSSQSPYKRTDPTTEVGKAQVQTTTDDLADVFVDAVACNRKVSRDRVLADFGQGGSLVGAKAVAAGLADGVGSLEGVIASLSKGAMPCVPSPQPTPARKADNSRRPAMSEAETPTTNSTTETDLRRQLAEALKAKAEAEAEAKARAEDNERNRADIDKLRAERIADKAVEFTKSVTTGDGRRAYPAERKQILEGYERAAALDARLGDSVTFTASDGKPVQGSYLDAYKASILVRPIIDTKAADTINFADLDSEPTSAADAKAEAEAERRKAANREYASSL